MANLSHPFYPLGIDLPHYVPNTLGTFALVSRFAGASLAITAGTWVVLGTSKRLSAFDKTVCMWFALCKYSMLIAYHV